MAELMDIAVKHTIQVASLLVEAAESYITSMQEILYNTYTEAFITPPSLSDTTFIMATGCLASLGLLLTFYLLYVMLKLLLWIAFGSSREATSSSILDGLRAHPVNEGNSLWTRDNVGAGDGVRAGAEGRRWLRQAKCDLNAARNDFEGDFTAPEWVCYKCQQAVEKALKAYTMCMGDRSQKLAEPDRLSHDLCDLARGTRDVELVDMVTQIESLTGVTSSMRYPDFHPHPRIPHEAYTLEQAINVHRMSTTVLKKISRSVLSLTVGQDER